MSEKGSVSADAAIREIYSRFFNGLPVSAEIIDTSREGVRQCLDRAESSLTEEIDFRSCME